MKDGPLAHILATYAPEDIFNADETGLFYKMEPSSSYVLKGETCTGGKRSKERVTVLPCANMSGTEKLPLLVIGKFAKPRCFTGMNMSRLPTQYKDQKRAWMDGELFTAWLKKLDAKMTIRKRSIALIIDNCRAHPQVQGLKSIKIIFLPPNTTSCTQPMDQGIIQNLKVHYRHLLVKRGLLPAVEKKVPFQWTMLDTLSALKDAWIKVKPATIANCFHHCGFIKPDQAPATVDDGNDDPEDDLPLSVLAANLKAAGVEANVEEFVQADDNLATSAAASDEAIIEEVQKKKDVPVEDEDEDEDDGPQQPQHTYAQAMESLAILRRFMVTLPSLPSHDSHWQTLAQMETDFDRGHHNSLKQASITSFFKQ